MENNDNKKIVYHKGGYMPKKYKDLDIKLDYMAQNPPEFDLKNKKLLSWMRDMVFALKGK